MKKSNTITKIMAFFALFGIIIGVIGTGILIIFTPNQTEQQQTLSPEQYTELQKMIEAQSGVTIEETTKTLTGETK